MSPCVEIAKHWWQLHPPIGVFIGILGVLGVLVPLFREWGKIEPYEKALWTLLIFALLGLELRTLYLDRDEHDAEQSLARCQELQSFQAIATALSKSIAQAQDQYGSTISHVDGVLKTTQDVAKISKQNLEDITGGDSFTYAVPQGAGATIPLSLHNYGRHILTGVSVRVINLQDNNWPFEIPAPMSIGTISPFGFAPVPIPVTPQPDEKTGIASYWIFISAQNGLVTEMLQFRRSKTLPNTFAYRLDVTRNNGFDQQGKPLLGPKSVTPLANFGWSDERSAKPR